MQSKATTVADYLAELPADRRAVMEAVRAVILANLDKDFEEGMQYGMIGYHVPHRAYPAGYHCDPKQPLPFAGLASQKHYMSLYLMSVYAAEQQRSFAKEWAKTGKKLNMGKCCVRFHKLEDLALDVIGRTIRRVRAERYIETYESALGARSKRVAKPKTRSGKTAKPSRRAKTAPRKRKPSN